VEYSRTITATSYPDVFDAANNPVRIEFRFEADDFDSGQAGWYIDDVEVVANP
jgi:hypothetical protein